MLVLAADTSTTSLSVGLIDEKRILAEYNSIGTLKHSSLLIPTIQRALKKAKAELEDVGLFSVGLGPGSFTGLRVGVTAIRALALGLDRPLVGISSMDAIAFNGLMYLKGKKLLDRIPRICPILDAKKKQLYACIYGHDGDKILKKTEYLLESAAKLSRRLRGEVLFLGDGMELYREELLGRRTFRASFADEKTWLPKASVIAKMALKEFRRGKRDNPYDLVPLYLYARDCNVRKLSGHGDSR